MLREPGRIIGPIGTIIFWIAVFVLIILLVCTLGCSNAKLDSPHVQIKRAWVQACDIRYVSEPPGEDYWQPPEITEMTNKGDCEDKAIFLWYKLRHVYKVKYVYLVGGQVNELFQKGGHAWVEIGSGPSAIIMDPTAQLILHRYMLNKYSYAHADSKMQGIRAKIFMDVTGHRNLNPLWGWR